MDIGKIVENMSIYRKTFGSLTPLKFPDFDTVSQKAYEGYLISGCEFGVVTSITDSFGVTVSFEDVLKVKKELPNRWDFICGAITGAFVSFSFFLEEKNFELAVNEIMKFHNETSLPLFKGNGLKVPKASAESINCRDSIINWTKKTGVAVKSPLRSERCARVTADVSLKTVNMIVKTVSLPQFV